MLPNWGEWHYDRFQNSLAHLQHKWHVVEDHCEVNGRNPNTIEFTTLGTIKPTRNGNGNSPQQLLDYFGQLHEIGVDHIIVNIPDVHTLESLEILATDVIPHLHGWESE